MSTWYAATVRCPSCGKEFEGRFVRGANATRSPALREAALSGTLNRPACPSCGRSHEAAAALVYADPARGDWIAVARRDELAQWLDVERAALRGFHTTLETAAADAFAATHVRVVFDLDELRERLAIWDAKLDDGVIECVKLQCLRERPGLRGSHDRIRVARIAADGGLTLTVIDETGNARAQFEIASDVVGRVATNPAWRAQFPELFASGFVSIDRYLR